MVITDRVVGINHPTLTDVANRPIRDLLTLSGIAPDADPFPGLYVVPVDLLPATDNERALGSASKRWTDVRAVLVTATTMPGTLATAAQPNVTSVGALTSLTVSGALSVGGNVNLPLHDNGNSGTSKTIDWTNGNHQRLTLTGNCTLTFSNGLTGGAYLLELVQDATGTRTVTWPAAVIWPGAVAPTLTTTASRADVVTFYYDDIPATDKYLGQVYGLNFAV